MTLTSGSAIVFDAGSLNTAGGALLLNSGSIQPKSANLDAQASDVSFASGSSLSIAIQGPTADTQYDRLHVDGNVSLSGANLSLSVSFPGMTGTEVFEIVKATSVRSQDPSTDWPMAAAFRSAALTTSFATSSIESNCNLPCSCRPFWPMAI